MRAVIRLDLTGERTKPAAGVSADVTLDGAHDD
jgi:hypothetical protein